MALALRASLRLFCAVKLLVERATAWFVDALKIYK
jgi:hypothetical protein